MNSITHLRNLIFILFFIQTSGAFAQEFGAEGCEWFYSGHNAAPPEYSGYYQFTGTGDTVIGNQVVRKLNTKHISYLGELVSQGIQYVFESGDTLFAYNTQHANFFALYIFNPMQGDTLTLEAPDAPSWPPETYRLVVDTVYTETIDNQVLKKYKTSPLDNWRIPGSYYMDRIGGLDWFYPIYSSGIPEGPGDIRCYSDAEIDTNFINLPCDYTLDSHTTESNTEPRCSIIPNPASNRIEIQSDHPVFKINIHNSSGQLIHSKQDQTMDITGFPSGLYTCQIHLRGGGVVVKRFVKI
ncbi:MAG: T9SS type A sorting domain-containing protein [Saprospiraceae bacterium]